MPLIRACIDTNSGFIFHIKIELKITFDSMGTYEFLFYAIEYNLLKPTFIFFAMLNDRNNNVIC